MEYQIPGKIKHIGETVDVSNAFQKRELVVTTAEQYPQHILIAFTQGKVNLLDQFVVGEEVTVSVNLRGREWINPQGEAKYFNEIQGWKISHNTTNAAQQQPQPHHANHATNQAPANQSMPQQQTFTPSSNFNEEDHDDLPF